MKQDIRENLALAFDTLRTHKARSALAVLGVVIGVGVIIIVASLITGFKATIAAEIEGYGADTAYWTALTGPQWDAAEASARETPADARRRRSDIGLLHIGKADRHLCFQLASGSQYSLSKKSGSGHGIPRHVSRVHGGLRKRAAEGGPFLHIRGKRPS